jgi:hypothetical protein
MDTPESAKATLCRSNSLEIREHNPTRIADKDELHHTLSVDQNPHLAIDLARNLRQSTGELLGDQFFGWDASLVKLLQTLFLKCL